MFMRMIMIYMYVCMGYGLHHGVGLHGMGRGALDIGV